MVVRFGAGSKRGKSERGLGSQGSYSDNHGGPVPAVAQALEANLMQAGDCRRVDEAPCSRGGGDWRSCLADGSQGDGWSLIASVGHDANHDEGDGSEESLEEHLDCWWTVESNRLLAEQNSKMSRGEQVAVSKSRTISSPNMLGL